MADALGLAASVAGLLSLSLEIGQVTYSYISDVLDAPKAQKLYLQEIIGLSEVLVRLEDAMRESEIADPGLKQGSDLSTHLLLECKQKLSSQKQRLEKVRTKLDQHVRRLIWPFEEREIKKVTEELHRFRQIFSDWLATNTSLIASATLKRVQSFKQQHARDQLLRKLFVSSAVLKRPPRPLVGTGSWFTSHVDFREWAHGSPSVLYCYGPPGVGKSSLALTAADYISSQSRVCVLQFYADFLRRKEQTEAVVLQSFLYQLAEQLNDAAIPALIQACEALHDKPSASELALALTETCRDQNVYIIFDATDEFENHKTMVSYLRTFNDVGCRIIMMSRYHPDLSSSFSQRNTIEIRADSNDVATYVQSRFDESDFGSAIGPQHSIVQTIVDKSNGLFLLAQLLVDSLLELPTLKKMRAALASLPAQLEQAYESSMRRIESQPSAFRQLAHSAMEWVLYAKRPLRPAELTHALAVELDDEDFDEENVTPLAIVLRACAGLLAVDQSHGTVAFVHMSAYEFLVKHKYSTVADSHKAIAQICLTYMQFVPLRNGACSSLSNMHERLDELPFLGYAARYWGDHVSAVDSSRNLHVLVRRLLDSDELLASSFQALHYQTLTQNDDVAAAAFESLPKGQRRLHVASYWGLEDIVNELLKDGDESGSRDSECWTPLHWATSRDHIAVMKILLENSAPPDAKDENGWTPGIWASFKGNLSALQLLIDFNADILLKDCHGWSALRWAVASRQMAVVGALQIEYRRRLKKDIKDGVPLSQIESLNETNKLPGNASVVEWAAASDDHQAFDEALMRYGSDENYWNYLWSEGQLDPPIGNLWRLMNKAEKVNGVGPRQPPRWRDLDDSDSEDTSAIDQRLRNTTSTPKSAEEIQKIGWKSSLLFSAIKTDKIAAVKVLLETGADANYIGRSEDVYRSPLHLAAYRKDPAFARTLVKYGASLSVTDSYGQTALHQAVVNGFRDTVVALLEAGADVNTRRRAENIKSMRARGFGSNKVEELDLGRTSLMLACGFHNGREDRKSQDEIIDALIGHCPNLSLKDGWGRNYLHYAAWCGHMGLAEVALAAGVDVNCQDEYGTTPLHLAVSGSDILLIRLLLNYDADHKLLDKYGRHAIHYLEERHCENDTLTTTADIYRLFLPLSDPKITNLMIHSRKIRGYSSSDSSDECTLFSQAIEKGDWKLAELLRREHAICPTNYLDKCLRMAVSHCQPVFVELLCKAIHECDQAKAISSGSVEDSNVAGAQRNDPLSPLKHLPDCLSRLQTPLDVERFDEMLQILDSHGHSLSSDQDTQASLLLAAARSCNLNAVPRVLCKHGIKPFETVPGEDDVFLEAAVAKNLNFFCGLLEVTSSSIPSGHWLQRLPELPSQPDSSQVFDSICTALRDSNALNMHVDAHSTTLLSHAIKADRHDLAFQLISYGADTQVADDFDWRPLHWAVLHGNRAVIAKILNQGDVDVNAHVSLWAKGAQPKMWSLNLDWAWHGTPLHIACILGNVEIVKLLLEQGAAVNASAVIPGEVHHYTPPSALELVLKAAEKYDHGTAPHMGHDRLLIARILLEHGAETKGVTKYINWQSVWPKFKGFDDVWDRLRAADNE